MKRESPFSSSDSGGGEWYGLSVRRSRGDAWCRLRGTASEPQLPVERYRSIARVEEVPAEPLFLKRDGGQVWNDWVTCDVVLVLLASDRVIEILTSLNVTGWSTFDVEIRCENGVIKSGYSGFAVAKGGIALDWKSGRRSFKRPRSDTPKEVWHLVGPKLTDVGLNGREVVRPVEQGPVLLSGRVVEALREGGCTGWEAIPMRELELQERYLIENRKG